MPEDEKEPDLQLDDDEEIEIEFVGLDDDETGLAPAEATPETAAADSLRAEIEHLREMYLRKLAEFDNFRKRTDRERRELKKTAAEGLVSELLPVLDNFERAVQHADESEPVAFLEGVRMIARQFADILTKSGLEPIDPTGAPFDPELHEAVQRVEGGDHEPGTVVQVFSKGYTYGGRLIRPAMVSVAVDAAPHSGEQSPNGSSARDEGNGA
jgi:molecular chaperone GrpE